MNLSYSTAMLIYSSMRVRFEPRIRPVAVFSKTAQNTTVLILKEKL
jgi:hypothetical protein